jgi:hypothetical protein
MLRTVAEPSDDALPPRAGSLSLRLADGGIPKLAYRKRIRKVSKATC